MTVTHRSVRIGHTRRTSFAPAHERDNQEGVPIVLGVVLDPFIDLRKFLGVEYLQIFGYNVLHFVIQVLVLFTIAHHEFSVHTQHRERAYEGFTKFLHQLFCLDRIELASICFRGANVIHHLVQTSVDGLVLRDLVREVEFLAQKGK